jgi:hypothetical protein
LLTVLAPSLMTLIEPDAPHKGSVMAVAHNPAKQASMPKAPLAACGG